MSTMRLTGNSKRMGQEVPADSVGDVRDARLRILDVNTDNMKGMERLHLQDHWWWVAPTAVKGLN